MAELFYLLIGTCALHYCSFSAELNDTESYLVVNVYDKPTEVINTIRFDMYSVEMDTVINSRECA